MALNEAWNRSTGEKVKGGGSLIFYKVSTLKCSWNTWKCLARKFAESWHFLYCIQGPLAPGTAPKPETTDAISLQPYWSYAPKGQRQINHSQNWSETGWIRKPRQAATQSLREREEYRKVNKMPNFKQGIIIQFSGLLCKQHKYMI